MLFYVYGKRAGGRTLLCRARRVTLKPVAKARGFLVSVGGYRTFDVWVRRKPI